MEKKLHTLPDLPYAYDALEPYISKEIMTLHHDKHHAAYVNNLNAALEAYPDWQEKTVEELLTRLDQVPEAIRMAVRNNGGGHVNHSMFWKIMASPTEALAKAGAKGGGQPSGKLAEEIKKQFGSFEEFQTKFNDAGAKRFGSGWVWLVKNSDGALEIMSTANQDNPMSEDTHPIMGNDVWEHAYYLQYKNVRPDYLKAWWNVVNWQEINKKFEISN